MKVPAAGLFFAVALVVVSGQRQPIPQTPPPVPVPSDVAAGRWRLVYQYDKSNESLSISDFQILSARRGIAVGDLTQRGSRKEKGVALLTSDGGTTWTAVPLKSSPNTLFFVDDSTGWLVSGDGVYVTLESGRTWQKLKGAPDEIARVYFKDRLHGWGFGAKKALFETFDGGRKWTPVLAAARPASRPEFSAYLWMDFANSKTGILVGNGRPPRPGSQNDLPPWLDPASAERRPEWPSVSLFLETHDGGSTWAPKTASLFGAITRLRLLPNGMGLALFEFQGRFDFPSEVLRLDLTSGRSESCLRRRDRATTDILLTADGTAYAAGYEPPGRINSLPIPGKVRILKSDQPDRRLWQEMPVDYRAVACRVYLSAPSPDDVWAATDTGMILKLSTGSEPPTAKH